MELVRGEVTAVDPAAKTVRVGDQALRGDAIVIALGAEVRGIAIDFDRQRVTATSDGFTHLALIDFKWLTVEPSGFNPR